MFKQGLIFRNFDNFQRQPQMFLQSKIYIIYYCAMDIFSRGPFIAVRAHAKPDLVVGLSQSKHKKLLRVGLFYGPVTKSYAVLYLICAC